MRLRIIMKSENWLKVSNINLIKGRTKNFWVEIRNKKTYYDILIGKKGKKAHIHYGINPDFTLTFLQDRNMVQNIRQKLITEKGEVIEVEDKIFPNMSEELTLSYKGICRGDGKMRYFNLTEIRLIEKEKSHEINNKEEN